MHVISKHQLKCIYTLLFNRYEVCGHFDIIESKEPISTVGFIIENRGLDKELFASASCYYTEIHSKIWHTHPVHSKGYPSPSDILRIINKKYKTRISLIFTKDGIWYITSRKKANIRKDKNWYTKIINNIASTTVYKSMSQDNVNMYIVSVADIINRKTRTHITMKFRPWKNFESFNFG